MPDIHTLLKEILSALDELFKWSREKLNDASEACKKFLRYLGRKLDALLSNAKFWNAVKCIPILGSIFGTMRCMKRLIEGDWQNVEMIKDLGYVIGGMAAMFIPLYLGLSALMAFLLGGTLVGVIGGGTEFSVNMLTDESMRNASWDDIEAEFYDKIVRCTPLIAVGYCPVRVLVYLYKGNTREAGISGCDFIVNSLTVAVGYWFQKLVDAPNFERVVGENLSNISNPFIRMVLRTLGRLLVQDIVRGIHISSTRIYREEFPYDEVTEEKFLEVLRETHRFAPSGINHEYLKKQTIAYILKCLVEKNQLKDACGRLRNGLPALEVALNGGYHSLVKAVLTFHPTAIKTRVGRERLKNLIDTQNQDAPGVLLMNPCCKFSLEAVTGDMQMEQCQCCSKSGHQLRLGQPIIFRPGPEFGLTREYEYVGRVLSIDGGGTKGLVALEVLSWLEERLPGHFIDNFDVFLGTSTGGLIALLLADGKSINEIRQFYFRLKDEVLSGRRGNVEKFESVLQSFFPNDAPMSSIPSSKRVVITATVIGADDQLLPTVFTNFDETSSTPIWKVARYTSAAPGLFPPVRDSDGRVVVDGGLTNNNPVLVGLDSLENFHTGEFTIVSVGCGKCESDATDSSVPLPRVSKSRPGTLRMAWDGNLDRFVNQLINRVTDVETDSVRNAIQLCRASGAYYYRLNPTLSTEIAFDETDNETLLCGIWQAQAFCAKQRELFNEITERLKVV